MAATLDRHPELRFFGVWPGFCVENEDPLGLHRIRFKIPGLIEPRGPWAMPAGYSANHKEGNWDPPAKGMNVWCMFAGGDPKRPLYFPGPWGTDDPPFDDITTKGIRYDDFVVAFDTAGHVASFEDLSLGLKVELNRVTGSMEIFAPAEVKIRSTGTVRIEATGCEILGRPVNPAGGEI